ncbi:MAG: hypothetical protein SVE93_00520 [Candidatus Thermoplasmatota archaeon]|nr:hypothetical protein [Candidatus Thermoplasmatota archaeon]
MDRKADRGKAMSWLSEYRKRAKRYNEACRELKEKGEIDITKIRDIQWAQWTLVISFISFGLPFVALREDLERLVIEFPKIKTVVTVYLFVMVAIYFVLWWQEMKLDSEVNKKVKAYLKQKEANYER